MHCFSVGYQGTVGELNRNSYFSILGHPSILRGKTRQNFAEKLFVKFFLEKRLFEVLLRVSNREI
jgi:hypothetical protein